MVPWALPGEVPTRGGWSARTQLREVDSRQYSRTAEMVPAPTANATGALGQQRTLRPIEIVQLSTCAWQSGLAESLESERVVGPRRSFPGLLAALRRTNYQQNVAQEFLGLVADLPVGLLHWPPKTSCCCSQSIAEGCRTGFSHTSVAGLRRWIGQLRHRLTRQSGIFYKLIQSIPPMRCQSADETGLKT